MLASHVLRRIKIIRYEINTIYISDACVPRAYVRLQKHISRSMRELFAPLEHTTRAWYVRDIILHTFVSSSSRALEIREILAKYARSSYSAIVLAYSSLYCL